MKNELITLLEELVKNQNDKKQSSLTKLSHKKIEELYKKAPADVQEFLFENKVIPAWVRTALFSKKATLREKIVAELIAGYREESDNKQASDGSINGWAKASKLWAWRGDAVDCGWELYEVWEEMLRYLGEDHVWTDREMLFDQFHPKIFHAYTTSQKRSVADFLLRRARQESPYYYARSIQFVCHRCLLADKELVVLMDELSSLSGLSKEDEKEISKAISFLVMASYYRESKKSKLMEKAVDLAFSHDTSSVHRCMRLIEYANMEQQLRIVEYMFDKYDLRDEDLRELATKATHPDIVAKAQSMIKKKRTSHDILNEILPYFK